MDLTSWSAGEHATVALMNARIQANFAAVGTTSTYTPTIGGTGWAKGNGTCTGYYVDTGALVVLTIKFVLGTTSTGGTGALTFSAPVGSVSSGSASGTVNLYKGAGQYAGEAWISTSTITPAAYTVSGSSIAFAGLANGVPSAGNWASADQIYVTMTYFR